VVDILDAFGAASGPERLELVRIGATATMVQFFTRDGDRGRFHWEEDPTVSSYVLCPGIPCPLCFVHEAPTDAHLLPVLAVERKAVGVLMVSLARGPASLGAQLIPHLRDEGIQDKLFLLSRERAKYSVEVHPLGERADRCLGTIKAFTTARDAGLSLLTAFPNLSAQELADVPRVRAKLDALGGWTPPGA